MCLCDCNRRLQIPSLHPPSRGKAIAISSFAFLLDRDLCILCILYNCTQDKKMFADKNTFFMCYVIAGLTWWEGRGTYRGHKVKSHPRSRVISRDDDSLLLLYMISIIGGGRLLWKPFPYFEEGGGEVGGRLAKEPLYPLQSTPQFPGQEWSQGKMTHRQCSPLLYVSMI